MKCQDGAVQPLETHYDQAAAMSIIGCREHVMTQNASDVFATDFDEQGLALARLLDGHAAAQAAHVLALLGVPDHLGEKSRSGEELAAATGAAPGPLTRLLAAATMYGLVTQDDAGRFALTPMGARLRTDVEGSMRNLAVGLLLPPAWQGWGRLADIVKTGKSVRGTTWDYLQEHPDAAAWFSRAMTQITSGVIAQLVATGYKPPSAERIVDVGGGRGTLLAGLLRSAPQARGVVLDQAEAMHDAPAVFAEAGVSDRAETIAGDFFDTVPAGDLHVLSNILHAWEDDKARQIVANCYRASRPGGGLLVIGFLLPSPPGPSVAYMLDLAMMVVEGGKERTLSELQSLVGAEGYVFTRDFPLGDRSPWHVVEFTASVRERMPSSA